MNALRKRIGPMTVWKAVFAVILALGLFAAFRRYTGGLGAASNLSDRFPWGLWIGFDLLIGVGLAAGGFVIAATVHIFKIEKYEPIARPTILTAFLGYLLVIVALLVDVGRPWNMWHPIVMWNVHSVMFEVAWCVMLYTTVLALEFSPLVFERFGWHAPLRLMRAIYVPLVIVGVLLSTMHQSSLGTMYVIAPDKLHPLLYTPLLPVLFWISAIAGGLAMVIFESFMSWRAFGKRLEQHLLEGIARVIVVVLAVYGLIKLQNLAGRGVLGQVFEWGPEQALLWGELGLGVLLPMALFAIPRVRRSEQGLFLGAMLTIMGFVINRLNVSITGMSASSGVAYFPSFLEVMITIAVVAVGFVLFGLAVKHFPVFESEEEHEPKPLGDAAHVGARVHARPVLSGAVLAVLWAFLLVGAVIVGATMTRTYAAGRAKPAGTAARAVPAAGLAALTPPEDFAFPQGADSPGRVVFRHASHLDPSSPSCRTCHESLFRLDAPGTPVTGTVTMERVHDPDKGDLCASCHDGKKAFSTEDACDRCHAQ
jgi:c(7)-type cytochrome triheme protein